MSSPRSRPEREARGASAVEYGLLVSAIAAVAAVAVYGLGRMSGEEMSDSCEAVGGQISQSLANAGHSPAPTTACRD